MAASCGGAYRGCKLTQSPALTSEPSPPRLQVMGGAQRAAAGAAASGAAAAMSQAAKEKVSDLADR